MQIIEDQSKDCIIVDRVRIQVVALLERQVTTLRRPYSPI
jgi:hypothetical protein